MHRGELIGAGRSADIYAVDGRWVLRRYRDGMDARPEAAVMAHLAAAGFPVPRVRPPDADTRHTELVLQRLSGPTLLQAVQRGEFGVRAAGALLGDLLRRLHAVPAPVGAKPGARVLHLDLHPDNVMLTPDGPMVIDWSNTEEGPPGLDRAMSALILAQVAVSGAPLAEGAREMLHGLADALGPDALPDAEFLADARARRAANPTMSDAELRQLDDAAALVRGTAGPGAAVCRGWRRCSGS